MAHHASVKPDARRHAFAGAGASVLASSPPSGSAGGSSHQPSPMSSSRSNPTSRTQPPHPAFGGKAGASTPPLPRSKSLAQQSLRADADADGARRNLRFVLTSADLVTIEELGENQFVLAITRPELPLPRGSPQLKRQQTIEQTMHQLVGGGAPAPALPQSNTSLGSKPAPAAAQRMLSSPLFGSKGVAGSPSTSASTSTYKAHVPSRPVIEPNADAQQLRDASRAVENERLRRRAEYAEKQKEFRAAAAPPPPKPKPFAAAAARSPAFSGAGAASKAAKAAPVSPPAPVQASPPPPIPPPPPRPAWQRFVDEASGMPYWHHEASGLSTWTDPTAPVMPIATAAAVPVRDECAIS